MISQNQQPKNTNLLIQTCFLQLLSIKSIEKITVRELCELASIHRGTFYRYYVDMYDLADKIEMQLFQKFEEIHANPSSTSLLNIIKQCVYLIYDEKLVCGVLFKYKHDTHFFHKVSDMSRVYINQLAVFQQLDEREKLYTFNYLCAGILGVIQTWIDSDFQETPDTIIDYINRYIGDFIRL